MTGAILSRTNWASRHFTGARIELSLPTRRRTVREADIPLNAMLIADVEKIAPGHFEVLLVAVRS